MKHYLKTSGLIVDGIIYPYEDILSRYAELDLFLEIPPGSTLYIKGDYNLNTLAVLLWSIDKNIIVIPVSMSNWVNTPKYFEIIPANVIIDCDTKSKQANITKTSSPLYFNSLTAAILQQKKSVLILFSSGTTGQPKAVTHDFNLFLEKFALLNKKFKAIIFLNFDHIGGLNTLFSVISQGGTAVIPKSTQPVDVCDAIETYQIDLLPTTPSFLRMSLMSDALKNYNLSSLKLITYGTEFMPEKTLKALKEQLPAVIFKQTYGSTEIGILPTQSQADDSTWIKIDKEKMPYKVIEGILWVKVPNRSMKGYLNAEFSSHDDWVNTQDRVEENGDYLKILGRETDIINVGGNKVDPLELENFLLECDGVKDALVFAKQSPILGQIVIARIAHREHVSTEVLQKHLQEHCKRHLEPYKIPAYFIIDAEINYSTRWKKIRGNS